MSDLALVTVSIFALRHEAEIAKARLAAEGIPAHVQADDEGGLNPGFFDEYGVRLVVRLEQRDLALKTLRKDVSEADVVVLHPEHREAIFAHTRFCAPKEACGLLAFDVPGRVRFVYCLTNADRSPYRFTVDSNEHFKAVLHAESNGWEIAGSFHSHPIGTPEPSQADVAAALDPTWVHMIVAHHGDDLVVMAYRVEFGTVVDVPIHFR